MAPITLLNMPLVGSCEILHENAKVHQWIQFSTNDYKTSHMTRHSDLSNSFKDLQC